MTMLRSLVVAVAAAVSVLAAPIAADAWPAQTRTALNVRSGPGVGYHRIGVLQQYQIVNVEYCRSRWCRISYWRQPAWVSRSYLTGANYAVPVQPRYYYGPRYRPAPGFVYRQPGFSLYIGPRPRPVPWWW